MSIAETMKSDVATAMKAGERERVAALRLVLSELQRAAKDGGDVDELAVLRRERKRRRESELAYREAGRDDLADGEAYEAVQIEHYLPTELSDHELQALVDAAVGSQELSMRDMGRVVGEVMAAAGGRADGKRVAAQVKRAIAG